MAQRFLRAGGGEGSVLRLIERMSQDEYERLQGVSGSLGDAVIGGMWSDRHWLVVTTERLMYSGDDRAVSVDLDRVKVVSSDVASEIKHGVQAKASFSRVLLRMHDGEEIQLTVESGRALFALINVLKWATQSSSSQPADA